MGFFEFTMVLPVFELQVIRQCMVLPAVAIPVTRTCIYNSQSIRLPQIPVIINAHDDAITTSYTPNDKIIHGVTWLDFQ